MTNYVTTTTREEASEYVKNIAFRMSIEGLCHTIDQLTADCHMWNVHVGWYTNLDTYKATGECYPNLMNVGERYMLMVTELSEAMEGERTGAASTKIPGFTNEEEELADALIRICDYAGGRRLRLGDALKAKFKYNMTREDHLLENRAKVGGKKY